ncbi:uncharacterized protein LOC121378330 [Gigantopelta aegis]|uniref:uncharacterized protein LOC121378330 n=1 Tax=Gigantopelta aegis TaxID=1735272 RepID=UPI001B888F49|nr:uncharacterized protein LOC121378330 [Gigantopelta aegis]
MIRLVVSTLCISAWLWFGEIYVGESSVVNRAGWVCQVQDKIYHEGDNFTISRSGPCLVYQCRFGLARVVNYGCLHQNKCLSLGDQIETNCVKQECVHENGGVGFKAVKYGCPAGSGCIDVGQTYKDGCYDFICEKDVVGGNVYYILNRTSWGCYYNNRCFKENEIVVRNCVTKRCEKRGFIVGMFDTNKACKAENKCYMINETYTKDCTIFTCQEQSINGIKFYGVFPTGVLCQDSEGNCHKSGELFSIGINNHIRHNCTCQIHGLKINYGCALQ